jgi:hypothetical protein
VRAFRIAAFAVLAVSLASCAPAVNSPGSVPIAAGPLIDERAAIAAELSYATATQAGGRLVAAGALDVVRYRQLDGAAYAALLGVRAAYARRDVLAYAVAAEQLRVAVAAFGSQ